MAASDEIVLKLIKWKKNFDKSQIFFRSSVSQLTLLIADANILKRVKNFKVLLKL